MASTQMSAYQDNIAPLGASGGGLSNAASQCIADSRTPIVSRFKGQELNQLQSISM